MLFISKYNKFISSEGVDLMRIYKVLHKRHAKESIDVVGDYDVLYIKEKRNNTSKKLKKVFVPHSDNIKVADYIYHNDNQPVPIKVRRG